MKEIWYIKMPDRELYYCTYRGQTIWSKYIQEGMEFDSKEEVIKYLQKDKLEEYPNITEDRIEIWSCIKLQ